MDDSEAIAHVVNLPQDEFDKFLIEVFSTRANKTFSQSPESNILKHIVNKPECDFNYAMRTVLEWKTLSKLGVKISHASGSEMVSYCEGCGTFASTH